MRTTVFLNLKGGVAKTTTVVNVAAILARHCGRKVVVIDGDSQCNLTEFFGGKPEKGNLAQVLRREEDGAEFARACIRPSRFKGVDILPGDDSLMDLDLTKVELQAVRSTVLRDLVQQLKREGEYDYCLVDCPPAFNAASAAALIAADDVVIPMKLDAFSLRGMACMMRQIANMRKINPGLKLAGCLPTMFYKAEKILQAQEQLKKSGLPVFSPIRRTDKVDNMTFVQDPLLVSSPRSAANIDYLRFVREYMEGLR